MKQSRKEPKPVPATLHRHAHFMAATCSCVYCPNSISALRTEYEIPGPFPLVRASMLVQIR
ncbi:hypothetical protein V8C34DRAFT_57347 [Trichoderma compactum]